jgi:hypothetical protein
MHKVNLFPGDTLVVDGQVKLEAKSTCTLESNHNLLRIPADGLKDLPETPLRSRDLWQRVYPRAYMKYRQDLRCPCGSAYTRQSNTHVSCQHCGRAWENKDVPE